MKFVFEIVKEDIIKSEQSAYNRLRRMMMTFETMVNTVMPEFRVHLKEEE